MFPTQHRLKPLGYRVRPTGQEPLALKDVWAALARLRVAHKADGRTPVYGRLVVRSFSFIIVECIHKFARIE